MQAIRKVGSRRCRDYVLVFPLLFCGFVDQTALRTLALDPGDARSQSIADLTAPEIPDNDPGLGSFGDDGLFRRSGTGQDPRREGHPRSVRALARAPRRECPDPRDGLTDYDWPGNVRELENLVKRWVVLGDDAVRNELASRTQVRDAGGWVKDRPTQGVGLREIGRRAAQAAEQTALRDALARVGGNRAAAARLLQVSYRTLLQKLSADEHGSRSGARSRTAAGDAGPQPGDGALA